MVISPLLLEGREEEHKFCVKPKKKLVLHRPILEKN
jgi:hypothetical protein